jgi:lauroyl/myristoyl acyltransferase
MSADAAERRDGDSEASGPAARAAAAALAVPRWHAHAYNRAVLYRLAGALGGVPRPARLALARRLGRLAARCAPDERAASRAALARFTGAQGPALDALTLDVFRNFAMCFSDLVSTNRRAAGWLASRMVRDPAAIAWPEALAGGGAVSLSAHVGSWELAGRLLATRSGRPTHVVVSDDEAPELLPWVRRNGDGLRFVPRSRPTVSLELVAALRRGEIVALHGDRALGNAGDILVPFFDHPAPFPIGPFRLARAAGVPVVPAFCVLDEEGRYQVLLRPPLPVPAGGEEEALRAWVRGLEEIVQAHPTHWFNFFDVWAPVGA